MAADDEDGSQCDNKNEDSCAQNSGGQISIMQQEVESQVTRSTATYSDKVNAVLSGWDCLAGTAKTTATPMLVFADFLYRWTLRLVLQGDWPGLQRIVKTRLSTSLHRCSLSAPLSPVTSPLLPLVTSPWERPQLKHVLDSNEVTQEEGLAYLSSEAWDVVRVRVDCLLEARCEQFAYRVLTVCNRCLRDPDCSLPECPDDEREYFTDLYFVLLFKFDRNAFLDEVKLLPVEEGVAFVQRLLHRTDAKSRVWKHRLKIGDIASKIFLATTIVKDYTDIFWHVFGEWCSVQLSVGVDDVLLVEMVRRYISLAYCQRHLYTMGSVLHFKCEGRLQSLVIELLIRGLTLDLNDIETLKLQNTSEDTNRELIEIEQRMSMGFLELAAVFESHAIVSRECVLTAFSLHPTSDKLEHLQRLSMQELTSSPSKIIVAGPVQYQSNTPENDHADEARGEGGRTLDTTTVSKRLFQDEAQPMLSDAAASEGKGDPIEAPIAHTSGKEVSLADKYDLPTALTTPFIVPTSEESQNDTSPGYTSPGYTSPAHLSPSSSSSTCQNKPQQEEPGAEQMPNERISPVQESIDESNQSTDGGLACKCGNNDSRCSKCVGEHNKERAQKNIVVDTGQPPTKARGPQNAGSENDTLSDNISNETCHESAEESLVSTKQISNEAPESAQFPEGASSEVHDVGVKSSSAAVTPSLATLCPPYGDDPSCSPASHSLIPATSTLAGNSDILTNPGEVLDGEKLGLPKELCDDLAVVLSSPRWQGLSWMFGWRHLKPVCEQYIVSPDSVKNMTKELKYLELDYNQFSHLPSAEVDEFSGIEKGYEQYMYDESDTMEQESQSEYADGQTVVHGNQNQDTETVNRKPNRGRGKVKSTYYDSDSDYDSGGFQKFKSADSDSESEDYTRVRGKSGKSKTVRHGDDDWTGYVDGKKVRANSHKDRRKRLRIDEAIDSVIARHATPGDDINSGANQSSTNDDSIGDTTEDSDAQEVPEIKHEPLEVLVVETKQSVVPPPPLPSQQQQHQSAMGLAGVKSNGKAGNVSSRAQMMKRYQVPSSLRFFRKPPFHQQTRPLPYAPPPCIGEALTPRFGFSPDHPKSAQVRCVNHKSRPRTTQLIAAPPRQPTVKPVPIVTSNMPSSEDRDSPEIIEVTPSESIKTVRTIKSVMYNSRGIPIAQRQSIAPYIPSSTKVPNQQQRLLLSYEKVQEKKLIKQQQLKYQQQLVERMKQQRHAQLKFPVLPHGTVSVTPADPHVIKPNPPVLPNQKSPNRTLNHTNLRQVKPQQQQQQQQTSPSSTTSWSQATTTTAATGSNGFVSSNGSNASSQPNNKWRYSGCLYAPPSLATGRAQCTFKTRDGRVIPLISNPNLIGGSCFNKTPGNSNAASANTNHSHDGYGGGNTNNNRPSNGQARNTVTSPSRSNFPKVNTNSNHVYTNKNLSNVKPVARTISSETIAKYLMKQEENGTLLPTKTYLKNSSVTITRKQVPVEQILDKRKLNGFSNLPQDGRQPLASAQKNVLNRLMAHDNGFSGLNSAIRPPIRAMPVSHTPPNVVLDKSGTGLNRALPKGTTVVRKNRQDPGGAGPSGLNNGGPSGASSSVINSISSEGGGGVIRPRVMPASRSLATAGPTRFIAQNVIHSSASLSSSPTVIHASSLSNNALQHHSGGGSQSYTLAGGPPYSSVASTAVSVISSAAGLVSNHQGRAVINSSSGGQHLSAAHSAPTFVITNNSSGTSSVGHTLVSDVSRDGIILSSGIGNQVFTHSNANTRDLFLTSRESITLPSSNNNSRNVVVSSQTVLSRESNHRLSSSSQMLNNNSSSIASLLNASSLLEMSHIPGTSLASASSVSPNFLTMSNTSNMGSGAASSNASPAPLGYATLVGGAPNVSTTLGGAPSIESNPLSAASTVATLPRVEANAATTTAGLSGASDSASLSNSTCSSSDGHLIAATIVSNTARLGAGMISGGGLLGRVLAASGASGVRLLGGSCVTTTTTTTTAAGEVLGAVSMAISGNSAIVSSLSNNNCSSISSVSSSSVATNHQTITVTCAPSMLETLLRDSPVKRSSPVATSVSVRVSTTGVSNHNVNSSGSSQHNYSLPTSLNATSPSTSLGNLLNNSTVITSGSHQIRIVPSTSGMTSNTGVVLASANGSNFTFRDFDANETITLNSVSSPHTINVDTSSGGMSTYATANTDAGVGSSTFLVGSANVPISSNTVMVGGGNMTGSVLLSSGSALPGNVILTSGNSSSNGVLLSSTSGSVSGTGEGPTGLQQVLVPAQLVQVQTNDGSTGLGLVHSTSLDIRLPAGTRVIKSNGGSLGGTIVSTLTAGLSSSHANSITTTSSLSSGVMSTSSVTPTARQLSLLQNVKILQNRQLVRTVVMPNSVALQGIGSTHQGTQLVAISGSSTATSNHSETAQLKMTSSPKGTTRNLGTPCGLVIRTVRPQLQHNQTQSSQQQLSSEAGGSVFHNRTGTDRAIETVERLPPQLHIRTRSAADEGLAERLSRHYLKTVNQLNASTTVQSVGTQTQTTAVKNTAGQLVSQVVMNNLTGTATVSSLPTTAVLSVASSNNSQNPALSPLPLAPTNAVSSETLEQLREFESVFEKVSNKSTKDDEEVIPKVEASFPVTMTPSAAASSEESMIAAQLLSMANDTPARTTQSYVYSLPSASPSPGTYITIPSTTQPGTFILVNNPSIVTAAGSSSSQVQNVVGQVAHLAQPPPSASPALSTTSSHSSIASSPSSTPSKKKPPTPKPKIVNQAVVATTTTADAAATTSASTTPTSAVVANPKTPPPPKAPSKPQMAKPQVEDNDEIRARIKVILENYKMLLAETPQQQPAPRNRKNCPPSRNESKSAGKKKSTSSGKKLEGSTTNSPIASDPGTSASPSPVTPATPTPSNMLTDGVASGDSGVSGGLNFQSGNSSNNSISNIDDKVPVVLKNEVVPGVVVSTIKTEGSAIISGSGGNVQSLTQTLPTGSRIVQFIRTGSKVTAITTRQPLYKGKTGLGNQSGPPPNVTIQGRINMSDLMESHLASLLSANPQATVISKKMGDSNSGTGGLQQLLLQTQSGQLIPANQVTAGHLSGGQSVISSSGGTTQVIQTIGGGQQVVHSGTGALVQLPAGQQVIHTATGQVVHLSSSGTLLPSGTQVLQTTGGSGTSMHTLLQGGAIVQAGRAHLVQGTSTVLQPGQQILVQQSPNSGVIKQVASQAGPSESVSATVINLNNGSTITSGSFGHGSSSFRGSSSDIASGGDESNSSEQSDSVTLPPFFTLAKSLLNANTNKQSNTATASSNLMSNQSGNDIFAVESSNSRGQSVLIPSTSSGKALDCSALVAAVAKHHRTVVAASVRTNSIDSLKSDLSSSEEVPPSPDTLNKQLQNAYLSDAALLTAISGVHTSSASMGHQPITVVSDSLQHHHQHSSVINVHDVSQVSLASRTSSMTHDLHNHHNDSVVTSHDLNFPSLSPTLYQSASGDNHGPPSIASTSSSTSSTHNHGGHSGGGCSSAMIQSPSGDMYLDGTGGGLGLDAMPLVAGMEGRGHSPALSDLVAAGTLLPWSPRSADSMMAQSPTTHDALSANMGLDLPHSSDTLCDSSTPFPGLFSMEGDAASVSSSASDELNFQHDHHHHHHSLQDSVASPVSADVLDEHASENLGSFSNADLSPGLINSTANQDQTISSSRVDGGRRNSRSSCLVRVDCVVGGSGSILDAGLSTAQTPWRFESVVVSNVQSPPRPLPNCSSLMKNDSEEEDVDDVKPIDDSEDSGSKSDFDRNKDETDTNAVRRSQRNKLLSGDSPISAVSKEMTNASQNGPDNVSLNECKVKSESDILCLVQTRVTRRSAASPNLQIIQSQGKVKEESNTSQDQKTREIKVCKSNETKDSKLNVMKNYKSNEEKDNKPVIKDEILASTEEDKDAFGRGRRNVARKRHSDEITSTGENQPTSDFKRVKDEPSSVRLEEDPIIPNCSLGVASTSSPSVVTRDRHASSNSDCSSTSSCLFDAGGQPPFLDSPLSFVGKRRRVGGGGAGSRDSSVSSRDDSPAPTVRGVSSPLPLYYETAPVTPSGGGSSNSITGMTTRRASNRDHAKKQRCSCCIGEGQGQHTNSTVVISTSSTNTSSNNRSTPHGSSCSSGSVSFPPSSLSPLATGVKKSMSSSSVSGNMTESTNTAKSSSSTIAPFSATPSSSANKRSSVGSGSVATNASVSSSKRSSLPSLPNSARRSSARTSKAADCLKTSDKRK